MFFSDLIKWLYSGPHYYCLYHLQNLTCTHFKQSDLHFLSFQLTSLPTMIFFNPLWRLPAQPVIICHFFCAFTSLLALLRFLDPWLYTPFFTVSTLLPLCHFIGKIQPWLVDALPPAHSLSCTLNFKYLFSGPHSQLMVLLCILACWNKQSICVPKISPFTTVLGLSPFDYSWTSEIIFSLHYLSFSLYWIIPISIPH